MNPLKQSDRVNGDTHRVITHPRPKAEVHTSYLTLDKMVPWYQDNDYVENDPTCTNWRTYRKLRPNMPKMYVLPRRRALALLMFQLAQTEMVAPPSMSLINSLG